LSRSLLLLARPHDAIPHEERLIELHRAAERSTAWPLAECAVCRIFGFDLDGALHDASEAVRLGELDDDPMAVVLGLCVLTFGRNALGESALACDHATRAVTLADEMPGGEGHRLHPHLFRGIALLALGRHDDAKRAVERGRTLGEALGAGWALPIYHFLTALGHWDRGEWDDLLTEVDAGLAHSEERSFSIGQAFAYAVAARVHLHRGDLEHAATVLDDGDRLVATRGAQIGVDWLATARALLLEATGRRSEGIDVLRFVWEMAIGLQAAATLVLVGGDLARLAVAAGDDTTAMTVTSELRRIAQRSPDDLIVLARERYARGVAERDHDTLLEAVDIFTQLGHRFEAAFVREQAAAQLLADGVTVGAAALFDESLSCYDDIGARHEADRVRAQLTRLSPANRRRAPRRVVSGWDALTPTEREVVEEVCSGRSNGQVAERLGISRRTVEAHLRSIYVKLGVATRLALAVEFKDRDR
jgi:DNA-binding CsgD family transcriptional regulator